MNERESTETYREEGSYAGYASDPDRELSGKSVEQLEREIDRIREDMNATLSAIERKLSPGEILDRALHSLRGGPGEYFANLGDSVKANPLPSALVGIGLGWMMFSQGQAARTERGGSAGVSMEETRGKLSESAGRVKERVSGMTHSVSEKMHHAGEKMHHAGERVHGVGERARSAREGFSDVSHRSAERVRHAGSNVSDFAHEQPLLLGILGLAAGALVGALIPPTRQEDAWMGSASDRLKEQVTETGREQMERAKEVAGAAAETAREETQRQLH